MGNACFTDEDVKKACQYGNLVTYNKSKYNVLGRKIQGYVFTKNAVDEYGHSLNGMPVDFDGNKKRATNMIFSYKWTRMFKDQDGFHPEKMEETIGALNFVMEAIIFLNDNNMPLDIEHIREILHKDHNKEISDKVVDTFFGSKEAFNALLGVVAQKKNMEFDPEKSKHQNGKVSYALNRKENIK